MTFRRPKREALVSALKQLTDPIDEYGSADAARRGAVESIDWVCEHVAPALCVATDNAGNSLIQEDGTPLYWVTLLTLINTILGEHDDRIQIACSNNIEMVMYETGY